MTNNINPTISNNNLPDNKEGRKIFKPQFIPIWTDIRDKYKLNLRDCQFYGFVRFYIEKTNREFYFPDDDLMFILGVNSRSPISKAVASLKKKGLIKVRNTLETVDGQTVKRRFITLNPEVMYPNEYIVMYPKRYNNNNNYNNNKEKTKKTEEQIEIEYKLLSDYLDGKTPPDNLPVYW